MIKFNEQKIQIFRRFSAIVNIRTTCFYTGHYIWPNSVSDLFEWFS